MKRLTALVSMFFAMSLTILGQESGAPCPEVRYENRNQVDPAPLQVKAVSGKAIDTNSEPVASACVAIFRDDNRKLVAVASTGEYGKFVFRNITPGRYRLVVFIKGLCPSNSIVVLSGKSSGSSKHRRIVVHLRPAAVDDCSFADYT